jgi:hypothetical protein
LKLQNSEATKQKTISIQRNLQSHFGSFLDDGLLGDGGYLDEAQTVLTEVKDLNGSFLRPGVQDLSGVVDFELNNRVFLGQRGVNEGLEKR